MVIIEFSEIKAELWKQSTISYTHCLFATWRLTKQATGNCCMVLIHSLQIINIHNKFKFTHKAGDPKNGPTSFDSGASLRTNKQPQ